MSDYGERLKALRKAKYPDFSEDMDMHDITDSMSWMADRIEELEAKLAKAVEALNDIARQKKTDELETEYDVEVADFEGGYDMCIYVARTTLAELTGGKDE